ncbi:DM13 domain-containing protein [Synechococcus sp. Cruz-9H2]|uniref:DM13 domain-containing protein n=1 Tax=unclassified Synechococcus TaxID=2626047 RepID=UPI0020CBEA7C|nr:MULTISPECIES: DM13 domain-containing protein [unclassified Synechococcus]MCP9819591.1 DM13 domain-containing protein [Synechococcus sp. Cruz-9H2]MCP9843895.1 DM13 domain-containing protein [Synechococcus sp. Edmonson 11F2]MCP9855747.1 DM13 domain-containing protein [Synechococcus sp. Cruz-9C9]MCP9863305.1 DM13 domain-containing protein [Synechococcus sp. Cruz-7E5]MCP9870382.1 DM13 domain-containing protein [Synechococcus sp. Cruz-7B9]
MSFLPFSVTRGVAVLGLSAATMLAAQAAEMKQHQGSFIKAEAPVSGSFVIKQEGGKRLLMLSRDFKTSDSAPDLKLAFSPSATPLAMSKPPKFALKPGSYTVLAPLKSSKGGQSYVIPASIDLAQQKSVLIWCEKFNATMAWAPLGGSAMPKDGMMKK